MHCHSVLSPHIEPNYPNALSLDFRPTSYYSRGLSLSQRFLLKDHFFFEMTLFLLLSGKIIYQLTRRTHPTVLETFSR